MYPPDSKPDKRRLITAPWVAAALLSAVMLVVMAITGADLKTPDTLGGILNLEFAYRATQVEAVVQAWSKIGLIPLAIQHTWLDFLFLLGYAPFLGFTAAWLSTRLEGRWFVPGQWLARGAWIAGFLDILENAGLLYHLQFSALDEVAFFTALISVVKWTLALGALLYVLAGFVALVWQHRKGLK